VERGEVQEAGDARPGEGAEDAGGGDEDGDQGEGGGGHPEGGLGEEDGDAGDGGDGVGEQEPGAEEKEDVGEIRGEADGAVEGGPGVRDVRSPGGCEVGW